MAKVTIIGAGMAGLVAALRLAERGYEVTIFEDDSFVGGKFRATKWDGDKRSAFHEHSYHMFLNWYHNFWQIAEEIGAKKNFMPMTKVKFLSRGEFPRMKELVNFGSLSTVWQNLFSGVIPAPDMFLYMYSVVDFLGTPMHQGQYRDLISVNSFASTRPYMTEAAAGMYDEYLAKTFALASYESAAKTFQTFIEYGTYVPEPLYWSLNGDCYNQFLRPLEAKLRQLGVRIKFNKKAVYVRLDGGNVSGIVFRDVGYNPTLTELSSKNRIEHGLLAGDAPERPDQTYPVDGPVILAVPHSTLNELFSPPILNRDRTLGETTKLESVPMASVHLHLNGKFARRLEQVGAKLPREPVILVDSKYKLSFAANSSLWPDLPDTYLNVVASDSRPLNQLSAPPEFSFDKNYYPTAFGLSIDAPRTALDYILNEFRRFVPFKDDEIEEDLLEIDRNVGRQLFINSVGSWQSRPEPRTKIKNLFLAGDFCKTFIDVVCLEGATVSGLQAAECVRREVGVGAPIRIERPKRYPYPYFWPMKLALAPYAAAAKLWSVADGPRLCSAFYRMLTSSDQR
jgi:zeta-carotene desaturase